jgi:hypothetical protein
MAMCTQEEDKIKVSNGGTINYLKDNKKKNFNANASSSKAQGKAPMQNQSQQRNSQ